MALQLDDFTTRWARAVAAAGFLVAGAAATAQTTFTDRGSWEAAAGSFQTETFNAFGPGPNAPLGVFHAGLLTIETAENSPAAQGFLRIEDGSGPNNVDGTVHLDFEVDGSPKSTVTLIFDPPVRAWGADLLAPLSGNPIDIELDGTFWQQPLQTGTPAFLGFISETPVARVTFRDRFTSTSRLGLDNVSFGDEAFLVSNLSDGPVAAAGDLPGSLRQAVFDANANPGADVVLFAPGLSGAISLTNGELRVLESLLIDGPGADVITISGGDTTRIFQAGGTGVQSYEFNALTLADGNVTGVGQNGGAINLVLGDDRLKIRRCVFRNSSAIIGGAIATGGLVDIRDCSFIENGSNSGGSALYIQDVGGAIVNSTFSGNGGSRGTILYQGVFGSPTLSISHSTFVSNSTDGIVVDTAFANVSAVMAYDHSIFANNGGVGNVVIDNQPGVSIITSRGHNMLDDATGGATPEPSDQLNIDPMLGPLEATAGTFVHFPMAGSPALNAGDPTLAAGVNGVPMFDQRGSGFDRILDGRIDIGAIESIPTTACGPADLTTNGNSNGVPDGLVTLSDFSFYLSLWSQADPSADLTTDGTSNGEPDGVVTLSDFSFYLSLWGAACP